MDVLRPEDLEFVVIGIIAGCKAADLKPVQALSPEDFCNQQARQVFAAAQALIAQGQRVEFATLNPELTRMYGADVTMVLMQKTMQAAQEYALQGWNLSRFVAGVKEGAQR